MATSCAEAAALLCLLVSAIAAVAGHWKLGRAVPVWDAASMLQTRPIAQGPCFDSPTSLTGNTRLAVNVLTRSAENWQGESRAALVHEALGRMRVQDGDLSGALQDIRQAARAIEVGEQPRRRGLEDVEAVPHSVLDSVKARVRVKEAELLLLTGNYESAIDAVGDSISAGAEQSARPARLRVESLKVLITAAIRMSPSAEELEGIREAFEKTKESVRERADLATKAMMYEVTALLAEARNDLYETVSALNLAISYCEQAANVGNTLKRTGHRQAGDAAQAAELAALHSRMSQVLQKRAEGEDPVEAQRHQKLADELMPNAGAKHDADSLVVGATSCPYGSEWP